MSWLIGLPSWLGYQQEEIRSHMAGHKYCPLDGARLVVPRKPPLAGLPTCRRKGCGYVDYPNTKTCVAVVIESRGRVLLGKRRYEPGKGLLDLPGGFVTFAERAEEAARREVLEETGLKVRIINYIGSYPDTYGPHCIHTLTLGFTAVRSGGSLRAADDLECLDWFAPDGLTGMLAFPHQSELLKDWMARCGRVGSVMPGDRSGG
jgi:NADH pyrophosphatase NudC (nudix superfamily)